MLCLKLFEILDSRLEHLDIVVAGDVLVQVAAFALGVTHLAEYSAVGRDDALDGVDGVVRVEMDVGCSVAL